MSTFLIIKPDFEKITNLKKGWTQSGNMLQECIRKWHKMRSGKELSQVLMERHLLLEGKLDL